MGLGALVPGIIGLVDVGTSIYDRMKERKNTKYSQNEIQNAYNQKLFELQNLQNEFLIREKDYDLKIQEMAKELKKQNISFNKMQFEMETKLLEEMKKEEQKKAQEVRQRQIAIEQCKEYLNEEFINCIMNSQQEYSNIERKLVSKLPKIVIERIKNSFEDLFGKLFNSENIQNKITSKYIDIMKNSFKKKELKKMNFMLIGPSGVGKSTLINALLKEDLAKEGSGRVCTTEIKKYQSDEIPFLCLIDSRGAELGKNILLKIFRMKQLI